MGNLARKGTRNRHIRDYALQFSNVPELDFWLRRNYSYRSEQREIVRTTERMIYDLETQGYMEGDCDDIATISACMVSIMGYPARLTAIQSESPLEYDHVYCEAQTGWGWTPIDPTVEYGTPYRYFGVLYEPI